MRSSLSCDSCRRAKVKCVHEGQPPCTRCERLKLKGCVLTRPRIDLDKANRIRAKRKEERRAAAASPTPGIADASTNVTPGEQESSRGRARSDNLRSPSSVPQHEDAPTAVVGPSGSLDLLAIDRHIATLPNSVILKTLNVFANKFPELGILHLPTFMQEFESSSLSRESMALLGAVLAVTRVQLATTGAGWSSCLLTREEYASYTKTRLSDFMLQPPKIQVVQTLLIITLHEWGTRDFHKAWVYCGVAIRIMQALHSQHVSPYPLDPSSERHTRDAVTVAIETRTYWACFIMDCMVNSGTYNPPMLPMSEMHKLKIARPLSAVEFAFGPEPPPSVAAASGPAGGSVLDITRSFEILVSGFEIWAKVMEFIFNDGRKAPGMCAPHNCPWVPGSPWSMSWEHLKAWRAGQHRNLHYPSTSVAVHMTLGYGETFTYLNLLHYLCTLMLHREYTPFLPTRESVPQGPVDKPLLEAPAPSGWWNDSAASLFDSAENIARLVHEASECGVPLMTPFAGFCAFSAGYLLVYIYNFPNMNLGRSSARAEECMNMCLDYLEEFRHVWKIADGWIKTLQHASLLYGRAATEGRYRGRTRADFDSLHQSVHEFRVVDRSEQQSQEIAGADRPAEPSAAAASGPAGAPIPGAAGTGTGTGTGPGAGMVAGVGAGGIGGAAAGETSTLTGGFGFDDQTLDTNTLLNQLMAEVSSNVDEQGPWSQWWPPMEEVELPVPDLML